MFFGPSKREEHMIRVGVVGYGTIGKRVADAILLQDDMHLVGVTYRDIKSHRIKSAQKGHSCISIKSITLFSGHS